MGKLNLKPDMTLQLDPKMWAQGIADEQARIARLRAAFAQAAKVLPNPSSKKTVDDKVGNSEEEDFAVALQDALAVVGDFGVVLEEKPSPEDGFGPLQSERRLPHMREKIMRAICFLQAALKSEAARTMAIKVLPPEQAQYLLSERYANALDSSRVFLDCFVPEESLKSQREFVLDLASIVKNLGPEELKKLDAADSIKEIIKMAMGQDGPTQTEP